MNELIDELVKLGGATEPAYPPLQTAARLAAALIVGWMLGLAYRWTYTGARFTRTIPHTQVLLTVGGALIWLVVGDNLVRAFGLAGTIALIRYRTPIADPKDTTILLFSMVLGMACGLGQFTVVAIGSLFIIVTLASLAVAHRRAQRRMAGEATDLRQLMGLGADASGPGAALFDPPGSDDGRPPASERPALRSDRSAAGEAGAH